MRIINSVLIFYWEVLKESISGFFDEDMLTHAAALSYYMVFSLPSMLLIVLWTAAQFYSEASVHSAIFSEIGMLVGEPGAQQLMATLERLNIKEPTWWATAIGLAVLLFFATTVFDALRTALNRINQVKHSRSITKDIWLLFRIRFIAFGLLVSVSFILLVSLVLDAMVTATGHYLAEWIGGLATYILSLDALFVDLLTTALLFMLYFRYLPDTRLKWSDAWFGALLTAGMLTVGKYLIGLYIGNSEVADLYDAAGSILVIMLWVYYAMAIFLFGATFTFTRARLLNKKRK